MSRRLTTSEFIANARQVHGGKYDYSEVVYTTQSAPVVIICPTHGRFTASPKKHVRERVNCARCARTKVSMQEFLTKAQEVHGDRYDYSQVVVTHSKAPIDILCRTHGKFTQFYNVHLKGSGCPRCAGVAKKDTDEFIRLAKNTHGETYDYSESVYVGARESISILCRKHGPFKQIASVHYRGGGCPTCSKTDTNKLQTEKRFEQLKQTIIDKGLPYSYDFTNARNVHSSIAVTCDKGHTYTQRADGAVKYGCPTCAGRNSRGEQELRDFIESLGVRTVRSRKVAAGKEIDIWCPEHNVGFEYNGLYWHSDAWPSARTRHIEKSRVVEAKGGRLVHIWADDWAFRRIAVEHLVRAKLNALPSVGARQCTVAPVPTEAAKAFLTAYHLQGWVPAEYLGLWKDGTLIACIGISQARSIRGNQDKEVYELVRYAASARVKGGGSRLLSAWLKSSPSWTRLVTYCDLAQFDGGLYERMGFHKAHVYGPDYKVLFSGGVKRMHKSNVQKSKLQQLLGERFDPGKSEAQLCRENRIFRIWDCGKARYELHHQ